ncbi:MAG: M42 family metallopeptidase [Planctomycetota bacterium]
MAENIELLKRLCEESGAPGFEDRIRAIFCDEVREHVDRIEVDGIGNVIAVREGEEGAPKVMVAGHLDEIGFVVNHIDDKGFLRIHPLGGFDPKTLVAKRVRIIDANGQDIIGVIGTKPVHIMSPEERKKPLDLKEFFVDVGLPVEEVKERVRVGDPVTLYQSFEQVGNYYTSKSMDNRVSIYTLIELIKRVKSRKVSLYAVATVQEEIGLRGAMTATQAVQPDIGIAVDVTLACDVPASKPEERVTALGEGTAIKILDSSLICTPKLVDRFRQLAKENDIPHQMEILPAGGTDAGAIQRSGRAVPSITLSVPCRYVHSVVEMVHGGDLEATVQLLATFMESAHDVDLTYNS